LLGIYEFQLKNLDREFCELFEEFLPFFGESMMSVKTSQLRISPVESSVKAAPAVAPYNRVRELVKDQEVISLQECICKKEQGLLGNQCDRPTEVCLGFGDFAQFYIDNKMARRISVDEAQKVLDLAEASALVISPVNTQKLTAICSCCPCCCPNLKFAKLMPRPVDLIQSYYQARIDPDLCTACGDCIERCQMDAIKEGDNVSELDDGRCIGCGLCVSACPTAAISLVPKPDMEAPPSDMQDMMNRIAMERSQL
jgi:ferredoxin